MKIIGSKQTVLILSTILFALVLGACGGSQTMFSTSDNRAGSATALAHSCNVAATPHTGTSRVDQRIIKFQQRLQKTPESPDYLERLGWAYTNKARVSFDPGYYKLAEQTALCILAKQPDNPQGLMLRGHVLHNLHKFKQAEVLAHKLVTQRGLWFDHALLGDVLMEQGKLSKAVDAYQRMMDLRPGPRAYYRTAHIRWLKGDLEGAIEMMGMSVGAGGQGDKEARAWAQLRLAEYLRQAGYSERASRYIESALELQADYPPALLARGRLLLADGNYTDSIASLTRAVKLNPLPKYQWALIEALRAKGLTDEASQIEGELMQRGAIEDRRTLVLYLASTTKDVDKALKLARQELELRSDVLTLDAMAWALHAAGQHQEAYNYSKRALAEGTQDARLFYHASAIAAAAGHSKEAHQWSLEAAVIQQMLLPSEREQLITEFAAFESRISNPAL